MKNTINNFDYSVTSQKKFDEVVSAIEKETDLAGFKVLHVHDIFETLKNKGLMIEQYKIIEICNAKNAYSAIQAENKIGLLLPCKIIVFQKGNTTHISTMRPTIISQFFPNANLGDLPQVINEIIINIINKSK